jgi:hypothetical protein
MHAFKSLLFTLLLAPSFLFGSGPEAQECAPSCLKDLVLPTYADCKPIAISVPHPLEGKGLSAYRKLCSDRLEQLHEQLGGMLGGRSFKAIIERYLQAQHKDMVAQIELDPEQEMAEAQRELQLVKVQAETAQLRHIIAKKRLARVGMVLGGGTALLTGAALLALAGFGIYKGKQEIDHMQEVKHKKREAVMFHEVVKEGGLLPTKKEVDLSDKQKIKQIAALFGLPVCLPIDRVDSVNSPDIVLIPLKKVGGEDLTAQQIGKLGAKVVHKLSRVLQTPTYNLLLDNVRARSYIICRDSYLYPDCIVIQKRDGQLQEHSQAADDLLISESQDLERQHLVPIETVSTAVAYQLGEYALTGMFMAIDRKRKATHTEASWVWLAPQLDARNKPVIVKKGDKKIIQYTTWYRMPQELRDTIMSFLIDPSCMQNEHVLDVYAQLNFEWLAKSNQEQGNGSLQIDLQKRARKMELVPGFSSWPCSKKMDWWLYHLPYLQKDGGRDIAESRKGKFQHFVVQQDEHGNALEVPVGKSFPVSLRISPSVAAATAPLARSIIERAQAWNPVI